MYINFVPYKACHGSSRGRQLQSDDGNDGPHRRRREDEVNPFGSQHFNNEGKQDEQQAENDEPRLGVRVRMPSQDQEHRRNKGEAGTQIRGDLPFC